MLTKLLQGSSLRAVGKTSGGKHEKRYSKLKEKPVSQEETNLSTSLDKI